MQRGNVRGGKTKSDCCTGLWARSAERALAHLVPIALEAAKVVHGDELDNQALKNLLLVGGGAALPIRAGNVKELADRDRRLFQQRVVRAARAHDLGLPACARLAAPLLGRFGHRVGSRAV